MASIFALLCYLIVTVSLTSVDGVPFNIAADDGPIVELNQGLVQGSVRSTPKGTTFYSFMGIPYAQPPIGDLRFKAPVEALPWSGTLDGTQEPIDCIQPAATFPLSVDGVEDCLKISVFTTNLPETQLQETGLPVHVFIHGGGFFIGQDKSVHYGPEHFMDQSIIVVYMNYRLGSLGFLSTGDSAASGNWGLLDQQLSLAWVRDNIATFGGNPRDVTISGESAGSASVLFHVLSPMSGGLFHQAIAESGVATCPWAVQEHPLYYAQALGKLFNCTTDDNEALVDCLRQQDATELATKELDQMFQNLTLAFVPVVENSESGLFLTEDPLTLLEEGRFNQVPMIIGFNRDEGCLIIQYVPGLFDTIDDKFFDEVVPFILTVLTDYRDNLLNVSYAIKDEYYSDIDLNDPDAVMRTNIDLVSDMFIRSWSIQTINLITSHNVPVYIYDFNYVGGFSWTNISGEPDVTHGIELVYLYNMTDTPPLDSDDNDFSEQFVQLWADFISQGNPTPEGAQVSWTPTPPGQSVNLNVDSTFTLASDYQPERMGFWMNRVPAIVAG